MSGEICSECGDPIGTNTDVCFLCWGYGPRDNDV